MQVSKMWITPPDSDRTRTAVMASDMGIRLRFESRTETCDKHGPFESWHSEGTGLIGDWWTRCPECERAQRLEHEETEKQIRWEKHIEGMIVSAHIPPRFRNKT